MVKDVQPKLVNDEQQFLGALKQYGGYILSAIMLSVSGLFWLDLLAKSMAAI